MGSKNSTGTTPEAAAFVQTAINTNGVTVFSKTYCPYCDQASGRFTVPNVFVKTTTIGGGSDVAKLHREGKLIQLLKEAGVLA
ncbi:hypothetical protein B5M09_000937 [Aphanomyces astaci]|uniref:Uncharacterized protein n=1 Tax=Aphanomyces astaci TaxID=112090 RepID=A0A3R8DMF6_APHAT|nr:hypothetical protein B5M09_000937 [Aphanomyces astaci]